MNGYSLYPNEVIDLELLLFALLYLLGLAGLSIRFVAGKKRYQSWWRQALLLLLFLFFLTGFFGLLNPNGAPLWSVVFLYFSAALAAASFFFAFYEKRYWGLLDGVAWLFFLPVFQTQRFFLLLNGIALLYLYLRTAFDFLSSWNEVHSALSIYAVKTALDSLKWGLLIADSKDRILYVNNAFLELFFNLSISAHEKEPVIEAALRKEAIAEVDATSFILLYEEGYLLFRTRFEDGHKEITFHDVNEEMLLNQKLLHANEELSQEEDILRARLDEIKRLAHSQEKERLRSLVHDSFAEEVSFIHQILINPKVKDLRPLKELVHRGLGNYEVSYRDLAEMEEFYSLLGVSFTNVGDFASCPKKELALECAREAIDNALRHGNATAISISNLLTAEYYELRIANNGQIPSSLRFHNGLLSMAAQLEKEGGSLRYEKEGAFTLIARFPIAKK